MDDLLQIGIITTTHGIKGEVKVFPTTDDKNFLGRAAIGMEMMVYFFRKGRQVRMK